MCLFNEKLNENANWHFVANFPVYLAKNADLSRQLFENDITVSSFAYPDKNGPVINRIVLSSWHTKTDIKQLIEAIK